ncbi:MAG: 23S rRNA (uracil(1939)-C(5))-methyltransferase RlmD [Candidatus Cloacimonadota bacterium]|nr:MAG: 23S rRNA (uracil(1939)-C(5))-methyltransferase RlmD [Candidatus Cloacimonadota bacterium]
MGMRQYKKIRDQTRKLTPESMNWKGKFVAEIPEGKALISGAYPNIECEVEFGRYSKKGIIAHPTEFESIPDYATKPLCEHFKSCGGCTLQHINLDTQCELKRELFLSECSELDFIKKYSDKIKIIKSDDEMYYRNKMEFTFQQEKWGDKHFGLHEEGRFQSIVNLDVCHLHLKIMQEVFAIVRDWFFESEVSGYNPWSHQGIMRHLLLRASKNTGSVQVNFICNSTYDEVPNLDELIEKLKKECSISSIYFVENRSLSDAVIFENVTLVYGDEYLIETIAHKEFEVAPQAFFQTNSSGVFILYSKIKELLENEGALGGKLIDFYCGAGTIGIFLSDSFKEIIGIDEVAEAIENAKKNAKRNKLENTRYIAQKVEKLIETSDLQNADVLIVDPPRVGCHQKARNLIKQIDAKYIVYVACNQQTLQENLVDFLAQDKYEIVDMVLVDMFPQTGHLESVTLLKRVA